VSSTPAADPRRFIDPALRNDVRFLTSLLGRIIQEQEGVSFFRTVEKIRKLSKASRASQSGEVRELRRLTEKLSYSTALKVARAFTIYFQLVNVAEESQRIRRIRWYESQPGQMLEMSLAWTAQRLKTVRPAALQRALKRAQVMPVLTAHPTEVRRRTTMDHLVDIGSALEKWHDSEATLLDRARQKSKRAVEELISGLAPRPPGPAVVRSLPAAGRHPAPAALLDGVRAGAPAPSAAPAPGRPATVAPLAPQRYKVQFTASADMYAKLRLAQDLLRHQIPDGDPAAIFDRALTALLHDLVKQKVAATDRPRGSRGTGPGSRHIPAEVRRAVWIRDRGRCAFVSNKGRRCSEQGFLEFHHVAPHAAGGEPTAENIQLRCRAHNGYEAELYFGPRNTAVVREARASYAHPPRRPRLRPRLTSSGQLGPDRVWS
jgi:hypothetical protein